MIFRMRAAFGAAMMVGAILSGTGAKAQTFTNLSPVQSEDRAVTAAQGANGTLTFNEPEVWLDGDGLVRSTTRGIRLPAGDYQLEAEDADYLYYRASERFEMRVFQDGQVKDSRFMTGGIYVSKALIALVPAGVYFSSDEKNKTLVWKLGSDFMRSEGSKWTRTKVTRSAPGQ